MRMLWVFLPVLASAIAEEQLPAISASLSNTEGHHVASKCIDGNTQSGFCSSKLAHSPFLELDLGEDFCITRVDMHNRNDSCWQCRRRLGDYQIFVGSSTTPCAQGRAGLNITLEQAACKGRGSSVRLVLPGIFRILNLAEVQVFGAKQCGPNQPTSKPPTSKPPTPKPPTPKPPTSAPPTKDPTPPMCGDCKGKINSLELAYAGPDATFKLRPGGKGKGKKKKKGKGPGDIPLSVDSVTGNLVLNSAALGVGDTFGKRMAIVSISPSGHETITEFHTSCSKPMGPGTVVEQFTVVSGSSLKGGPICPTNLSNALQAAFQHILG